MSSDRYARHALIDWFSQDTLRAAHIAVIGAGAVGNEVVKNLALLGVGRIDVFDFDRIELHNLTRSVFFREDDVGRGKADVVAERAGALDPNVVLRAVAGDFWDTLSLTALAQYTTAICCVDNFEARIRLNQMCLITGVDLVNTGLDSRYATVETFPFSAQCRVGCYECHLPHSAYQRVAERYSCGGLRKRALETRTIPTTAITASVAGAYAVSSALHLGHGDTETASQRVLIDTITGRSTVARLDPHNDCIGCSALRHRPRRLRAKRTVGGTLQATADAITLQLSDPLITDYRCARCGTLDEAGQFLLQRASRFDESITQCPRCAVRSVHVDIRDSIGIVELETSFRGKSLPAKYALVRLGEEHLCIELED